MNNLRKYEIFFFDGYNQRYFEFLLGSREEALDTLWKVLEADGFVKNNLCKILIFSEKQLDE